MKIKNIVFLVLSVSGVTTLLLLKDNYTIQQSPHLLNTVWSEKMPLSGGHSDAILYKVSDGKKSYVLRDISYQGKEDRVRQIHAQKVASNCGYGPYLYAYDVDQGNILMSFLETSQDNTDLSIKALKMAELVKKIHNGQPLYSHELMIDRITPLYAKIDTYPKGIDQEKIVSIINNLEATKTTTLSPIHGDLNLSNIMFVKGEYKVIDFENAGQDDPFFDLATIIIFNFGNTPYETEFLRHYFGRFPSPHEITHLNRMKQAAFLYLGLMGLSKAPLETINQASEPINFYELLEARKKGILSMEDENTKFLFAQSRLQEAINLEQL